MANFNSIYLFYIFVGLSAAMFAEGVYLLVYSNASYRKKINRRLRVMSDKTDRESVLVQLRRERGLTSGGDYRLPLINLNQLVDRKSTRLNSSHGYISYAVFCLKKKK